MHASCLVMNRNGKNTKVNETGMFSVSGTFSPLNYTNTPSLFIEKWEHWVTFERGLEKKHTFVRVWEHRKGVTQYPLEAFWHKRGRRLQIKHLHQLHWEVDPGERGLGSRGMSWKLSSWKLCLLMCELCQSHCTDLSQIVQSHCFTHTLPNIPNIIARWANHLD